MRPLAIALPSGLSLRRAPPITALLAFRLAARGAHVEKARVAAWLSNRLPNRVASAWRRRRVSIIEKAATTRSTWQRLAARRSNGATFPSSCHRCSARPSGLN